MTTLNVTGKNVLRVSSKTLKESYMTSMGPKELWPPIGNDGIYKNRAPVHSVYTTENFHRKNDIEKVTDISAVDSRGPEFEASAKYPLGNLQKLNMFDQ